MRVVLFLVCTLSMVQPVCVRAGPAGRASITSLTASADAIVIGSVQSLGIAGTISATITVERVLKGTVIPGTLISFVWTRPQQGFIGLPGGKSRPQLGHGIFFLQRGAGGSWSILPAMNGDVYWPDTYIPIPSNLPQTLRDVAFASLSPNASPLDKVLGEMVVALEAGAGAPYDLVSFRRIPSPVLSAAFTRFLQNPKLMAIGLRGSILSGDPSLLLTIRQNYAQLSHLTGWSQLLQDVRTQYLNTTSQAVQILGEIATDSTAAPEFRIAAAGALGRMHTQQTLPYLAKLLGDPNIQLRETATGGMSGFANNVLIGTHEIAPGAWPYRTDTTITHSGYNANNAIFWQTWWQDNQASILAGVAPRQDSTVAPPGSSTTTTIRTIPRNII